MICNVCASQNKRDVEIDRLKDKPEKIEETKESVKTVIEETMQNRMNEIELLKISYKEALEKQHYEYVRKVSDTRIEIIF